MKKGDKVILKKFETCQSLDWHHYLLRYVGEEAEVEEVDDKDGTVWVVGTWWLQSACELTPCEPVEKERYFLISYSSNLDALESNYHFSKTIIGASMPNRKKMLSEADLPSDCISCYITSIFEFKSKEDYLDFIKE